MKKGIGKTSTIYLALGLTGIAQIILGSAVLAQATVNSKENASKTEVSAPKGSSSAKELTLDSAYRLAKHNYPLIQQSGIIDQLEHNAIAGLNKNWLPKLSFIASATYQSEVTSFALPGFANLFPVIPNNQFSNVLELEQVIFDGFQLKNQKRIEKLTSENDRYKNEVEIYKLLERVNQVYSGVLLGRANLKTLVLYKENLSNRRLLVGSAVNNGLLLESNWDELEVETLKADQQILEAKEGLKAYYNTLKLLTNVDFDDSTRLSLVPIGGAEKEAGKADEIKRPELKMFDAQKNLLDARANLTNSFALPTLAFIGEGIYGEPGYNFLSVDPHFFGKVGFTLKWNISSLYSLNNEKKKYELGKSTVDVQQQLFVLNLKTALEEQASHVASLQQEVASDKAISASRHKITLAAAAQLENGSLTTADYLIQLNAEMQALLNEQIHEIKLMNAITTYQTTKGISNY